MPNTRIEFSKEQEKRARAECYEKINKLFVTIIGQHYAEHPEQFDDPRGKMAQAKSQKGVDAIRKILDGYTIGPKKVT